MPVPTVDQLERMWSEMMGRRVEQVQARGGGDVPPLEANVRARETLMHFLSPEQREEFERDGSFVVTGNDTGTRYRILPQLSTNIRELWNNGKDRRCWCFVPAKDGLPLADIMLFQKLCLEADEAATMRIAHDQGPAHERVPTYVFEQAMRQYNPIRSYRDRPERPLSVAQVEHERFRAVEVDRLCREQVIRERGRISWDIL